MTPARSHARALVVAAIWSCTLPQDNEPKASSPDSNTTIGEPVELNFRDRVRHGGTAVTVRSAGLRDKHVGAPAHPVMIAAAGARGYDLSGHRGVVVTSALLEWADVILAMDHDVLSALWEMAETPTQAKLALYLDDRDVPDPWGQPVEAFTTCASVIEACAARHLA
jgi:protein-tyrosine phosphatase